VWELDARVVERVDCEGLFAAGGPQKMAQVKGRSRFVLMLLQGDKGDVQNCEEGIPERYGCHRAGSFHGAEKEQKTYCNLLDGGSQQDGCANLRSTYAIGDECAHYEEEHSPMPDEEHRRTRGAFHFET